MVIIYAAFWVLGASGGKLGSLSCNCNVYMHVSMCEYISMLLLRIPYEYCIECVYLYVLVVHLEYRITCNA